MSIKPQTSASCDEALFLTSADVSKDFSMTFCKAFEDRESGWITNKCKTNLMEVTQSNKGDWNLYFFGFPFDFFFFPSWLIRLMLTLQQRLSFFVFVRLPSLLYVQTCFQNVLKREECLRACLWCVWLYMYMCFPCTAVKCV